MRGGLLRARIGGWLFGGILEVGCGFLALGWSAKVGGWVSMGEVRVVEREGGRRGGGYFDCCHFWFLMDGLGW